MATKISCYLPNHIWEELESYGREHYPTIPKGNSTRDFDLSETIAVLLQLGLNREGVQINTPSPKKPKDNNQANFKDLQIKIQQLTIEIDKLKTDRIDTNRTIKAILDQLNLSDTINTSDINLNISDTIINTDVNSDTSDINLNISDTITNTSDIDLNISDTIANISDTIINTDVDGDTSDTIANTSIVNTSDVDSDRSDITLYTSDVDSNTSDTIVNTSDTKEIIQTFNSNYSISDLQETSASALYSENINNLEFEYNSSDSLKTDWQFKIIDIDIFNEIEDIRIKNLCLHLAKETNPENIPILLKVRAGIFIKIGKYRFHLNDLTYLFNHFIDTQTLNEVYKLLIDRKDSFKGRNLEGINRIFRFEKLRDSCQILFDFLTEKYINNP